MVLIIIFKLYYKNAFAHKCYYAYNCKQLQFSCSEDTNAHAQLKPRGSINECTYENGVQFVAAVIETVFFHSI